MKDIFKKIPVIITLKIFLLLILSLFLSDCSGNDTDRVVVPIHVYDTKAPDITLTGTNPLEIVSGFPYVDPGATAIDNFDGDISNLIIVDSSAVNTDIAGSYEVAYDVTDSIGNEAVQVIRTVNVIAPPCPVYVDANAVPGGTGTFDNPYDVIGNAIAYRQACGEIVLLAGTYNESVNYGGNNIHIRSESGAESTILNPAAGGTVVTFNNSENADAILEGITITGGTSYGIFINSADPTIKDCIITNNSGSSGTGIYAMNYCGIFSGNTVSMNSASADGGGFYLEGGTATLINNWFENNNAGSYGGGIFLRASALVANNVFLNNNKSAIYLDYYGPTDYDTSNVINNTIVDSTNYGMRIDSDNYPGSVVINNIIYNSGTYDVYVGGPLTFSNITWQNNDAYGAPTQYSNYDQTGTNSNISQSPNFVDAGNNIFSLEWPSFCIDSGQDVSGYGVTEDYAGISRPVSLGYDIGAYEYN